MLSLSRLLLVISAASIWRFFRRLGVFGLFLMGVLDSSFLILPFGNDLLLIAFISSDRTGPTWLVYVLVSALGSMLGVFIVDLLMRKAGEKGLEHFVSPRRIERLKNKFENKAGITLFLATLIPPPFPFTPAVMTFSALQLPRKKLLGIVFLGRLLRFGVVGVLALYFGRQLIAYINSDVLAYFVYALIAIAIAASTWSVFRWLKRK